MRNTERMMFNYVHNVEMPSEKCLTFCLFALFARIAEWRNVPCQNHMNYASSESRDRKMFGNKNSFSCQSNFAFCDKIHPKPYRGLLRHPTELELIKLENITIYHSIVGVEENVT